MNDIGKTFIQWCWESEKNKCRDVNELEGWMARVEGARIEQVLLCCFNLITIQSSFDLHRPISLLPCPSKVIERLVFNELYHYCDKFKLLSEKNSGFKKNDGTINQLINLTNKIYQGLDDEHEIAMIFLDLSKAYDRICHKRLLFKLRKIGIGGSLLKWIESYLSGKSQRVVLNGKSSEFLNIFGSVPQGSIFSSLFYISMISTKI